MIKKFFKVIVRNLWKHKLISLINILVLALVMTALFYLLNYLTFEMSFDKFHTNSENMYRVCSRIISEDDVKEYAINQGFVGKYLNDNFPEVIKYVNITPLPDNCTVSYEDVVFREDKVFQVDSSFFNFFSFPLVIGDPNTVLNRPYTVVLSESMAKKYFGDENPIGKVLKINGKYDSGTFIVTGIFKDFPKNSHFQSNCLTSNLHLYSIPKEYYNFEEAWMHWVYIQVQPGTDINQIAKGINEKLRDELIDENSEFQFFFQPLRRIHLYSNVRQEFLEISNGNYKTVISITLIGLICLLIAYFNFINTSIVRTIERAHEMGIRKTMGAGFRDNLKYFFTEAIVQLGFAFIGALIFYAISFSWVKSYLKLSTLGSNMFSVKLLFGFILIFIVVSLILGFIYSFIYSKVNPFTILKGKVKILTNKLTVKSIPMLIQFITCIVFLSFMLVVIKQSNYIKNKDLGFNPKNVIMILQPHLEKFWEADGYIKNFYEQIENSPLIKGVSQAVYNPGYKGYGQWDDVSDTKSDKLSPKRIALNEVRYNFFDLYEMKIATGRNFNIDSKEDEVIVNKSAVKFLGYDNPSDILGEEIYFYTKNVRKRVIGVVEDFHQESLKNKVKPVIFRLERENYQHAIVVRLHPDKKDQALNFMKEKWNKIFPESEFVYEVIESKIENLYKEENKYQSWLTFYAVISVLICIIGIIVITFYSLKEREKEIAIRKVLGASMLNLFSLSKGFYKILLLSLLIGLLISYKLSVNWLSDYVYHVKLSLGFAIIPIAIVSFVFLIALTFTVYKAFSSNPVDALKYE